MRTNIEIDDKLMEQALASTGSKTKKEVVDTALKLLVQTHGQGSLDSIWGALREEGWGWEQHLSETSEKDLATEKARPLQKVSSAQRKTVR